MYIFFRDKVFPIIAQGAIGERWPGVKPNHFSIEDIGPRVTLGLCYEVDGLYQVLLDINAVEHDKNTRDADSMYCTVTIYNNGIMEDKIDLLRKEYAQCLIPYLYRLSSVQYEWDEREEQIAPINKDLSHLIFNEKTVANQLMSFLDVVLKDMPFHPSTSDFSAVEQEEIKRKLNGIESVICDGDNLRPGEKEFLCSSDRVC